MASKRTAFGREQGNAVQRQAVCCLRRRENEGLVGDREDGCVGRSV